MKIGVLTDTHDQWENIRKAVTILSRERVKLVIHCGDWVSPFTLPFYKDLRVPIKGVFGNNDGDRFYHLKFVERYGLNIQFEERIMKLDIDGRKIFVYHGDYGDVTDALVSSGKYDAVFHGHTHQKINKTLGKTLSLNPGTLMPFTDEKTQGASFAIYNTHTNSATLLSLS